MVLLSADFNPEHADYESYVARVREHNDTLHENIAQKLEEAGIPPNIAVATAGSNARLEQAPGMPTELICFYGDEYRNIHQVRREIGSIVGRRPNGKRFDACGFLPHPNQINNNSNKQLLLRSLDAQFLYGDETLFQNVKTQLRDTLSSTASSTIPNAMIKYMQSHCATALQVCQSGKSEHKDQTYIHIDFETGMAFYSPPNREHLGEGSFKYGPLRVIQDMLLGGIMRSYHNGNNLTKVALEEIPSNIASKLEWLLAETLTDLSAEKVVAISDHYSYFLWLYHQSQYAYHKEQREQITFNIADVRGRLKDLEGLVNEKWVA